MIVHPSKLVHHLVCWDLRSTVSSRPVWATEWNQLKTQKQNKPQFSKASRFPMMLCASGKIKALLTYRLTLAFLRTQMCLLATFVLSKWVLFIHINQKGHPRSNGKSIWGHRACDWWHSTVLLAYWVSVETPALCLQFFLFNKAMRFSL